MDSLLRQIFLAVVAIFLLMSYLQVYNIQLHLFSNSNSILKAIQNQTSLEEEKNFILHSSKTEIKKNQVLKNKIDVDNDNLKLYKHDTNHESSSSPDIAYLSQNSSSETISYSNNFGLTTHYESADFGTRMLERKKRMSAVLKRIREKTSEKLLQTQLIDFNQLLTSNFSKKLTKEILQGLEN